MATAKRKVGDLGESLAEKYLKKKKYEILSRNYSRRGGEIDIIARDRGQFVFVEVKARRSGDFGSPAEAVTSRKLEKIAATARRYLMENREDSDNFRIDVIGVKLDMDEKTAKIRHFKSVTNS